MAQPLTERTAIVHDWFQGFHGAERVVEAMRAGLFAHGNEPDVFTFQAARELLPAELAARIRQESRLANLPGIRQRGHDPGRWRMLLPLMPGYFRRLDLAAYDTVIASSHACAIHARPREGALHVCYCYTPIRYAWLPETEARRARGPAALGLRAARGWLRRKDLEASRRPDGYIAISEAVRERADADHREPVRKPAERLGDDLRLLVRDEPVRPEETARLLLRVRVEVVDVDRRVDDRGVAPVRGSDPLPDDRGVGDEDVRAPRGFEVLPAQPAAGGAQTERRWAANSVRLRVG